MKLVLPRLLVVTACCVLQVFTGKHLMQCTSCYNSLVPTVASLPASGIPMQAEKLAPTHPLMLRVSWQGGVPAVSTIPFEAGASLESLALEMTDRFEMMQGVRGVAAPVHQGLSIPSLLSVCPVYCVCFGQLMLWVPAVAAPVHQGLSTPSLLSSHYCVL